MEENSSSAGALLHQTNNELPYDYLIRRADLDDVDHLLKEISPEETDRLNMLYDYPSVVRLF